MADNVHNGDDTTIIARKTTGKRFLYTIVFLVIVRLLEAVLVFVVLFELVYSLVTKRLPHPRVTRFSDRMLRYGFAIGQYVTFNENHLPYPFEDSPNGTEPIDLTSAATS